MRALLDVNILIALFDPDHIFHERAHSWWPGQKKSGWASCPLTENALVRVVSHPRYSRHHQFRPAEVIGKLSDFVAGTNHQFWNDDVSLRDESIFLTERIHGPSQLTDLYLLALAARHGGRLVTFDRSIAVSAVRVANENNLLVLD